MKKLFPGSNFLFVLLIGLSTGACSDDKTENESEKLEITTAPLTIPWEGDRSSLNTGIRVLPAMSYPKPGTLPGCIRSTNPNRGQSLSKPTPIQEPSARRRSLFRHPAYRQSRLPLRRRRFQTTSLSA